MNNVSNEPMIVEDPINLTKLAITEKQYDNGDIEWRIKVQSKKVIKVISLVFGTLIFTAALFSGFNLETIKFVSILFGGFGLLVLTVVILLIRRNSTGTLRWHAWDHKLEILTGFKGMKEKWSAEGKNYFSFPKPGFFFLHTYLYKMPSTSNDASSSPRVIENLYYYHDPSWIEGKENEIEAKQVVKTILIEDKETIYRTIPERFPASSLLWTDSLTAIESFLAKRLSKLLEVEYLTYEGLITDTVEGSQNSGSLAKETLTSQSGTPLAEAAREWLSKTPTGVHALSSKPHETVLQITNMHWSIRIIVVLFCLLFGTVTWLLSSLAHDNHFGYAGIGFSLLMATLVNLQARINLTDKTISKYLVIWYFFKSPWGGKTFETLNLKTARLVVNGNSYGVFIRDLNQQEIKIFFFSTNACIWFLKLLKVLYPHLHVTGIDE